MFLVKLQPQTSQNTITANPELIIAEIREWILNSNELSVSVTSGGMHFSYDYFFMTKKIVLDKYKRGEHRGVRFITFIDQDNIEVVKNYLDAGARIKHVKNLPPMSMGISDKESLTTLEKMENGKLVQNLLRSTDAPFIDYFRGIFDELWEKGIDAAERIGDIEKGLETDYELADARQYLNTVMEEVKRISNKAEQLEEQTHT